MRVRLKGINTVRKRLADGSTATYYYHRLTGERILGQPGTPEFIASIAAAERKRQAVPEGIFRSIIKAYESSQDFAGLSPKTQKDYRRYLRQIEDEFGDAELAVINDPRIRSDFMDWRDRIAARSLRSADYAWSILRRLIEWGVDRGKLSDNRAIRGKRLYASDRADKLWLPEHVRAFMAKASPELQAAMTLAIYTSQRQGDLLALAWTNYDGSSISLRQSKTGKRVTIPCGPILKQILAALSETRNGLTILTSPSGQPWKADHFRHAWAAACQAAGITDLHFHDLRGTAVTLMSEEGSNPQEIASIIGWSYETVETILEAYGARTQGLSKQAAKRLEKGIARTFGDQFLQTSCKPQGQKAAANNVTC